MGIISGLLLIVLGLMAAHDFIGGKVPALKSTLEKIMSYAEFIGVAGMLIGLIWLMQALSMLRFMDLHPVLVFEVLFGSLLTLTLGMVFGLPMLHKLMNEPTPSFLLKMDKWRAALQKQTNNLGLIAIVLGFLCVVV